MRYLLFLVCLSFSAIAQLREVAEVSFVLPDGLNENIDVLPVGDDIVLVNYQEDFIKRERRVVVLYYTSELQLRWTANALIPRFYSPVGLEVNGQMLYYLFKQDEGKKLHLVQFDFERKMFGASEFETITLLQNVGFAIFNGHPLISGTYNLRPVVEMHNLREKTAKVLADIYSKNNDLKGIFVNPYRDELYVFTTIRQNCQTQVSVFDDQGKFLYRQGLGDKKRRIRNLDVCFGPGGTPMVVGSYNSGCIDLVEGIFAGPLDSPNDLRYNSIASLPAFNASLSAKRKKRLQLRKEKGKNPAVRQKAIFQVPITGMNGHLLATEFYTTQTVKNASSQFATIAEHKIWRLLVTEVNQDGEVVYDRIYKAEGDPFMGLRPQSAFLFRGEDFFAFLPVGNRLLCAGPDKSEFFPLLTPGEGVRLSGTETKLFNMGPSAFIAHGVTDLKTMAVNSTESQLYFIKKFTFQ